MLPLSNVDRNGWYLDPSTGDAVLMINGTLKHRLKRDGTTTLPGATTLATGNLTLTSGNFVGSVASRTKKHPLPIGGWILGATPPTVAETGYYRGYAFDADAETLHISQEVPGDWTATGDMTLKLQIAPETGTAIADTETVIFNLSLGSRADTETADGGSAYTNSATYTQSGAGTDKATHILSLNIDHDNANQPLTIADVMGITLSRDFSTDTYAADIIVFNAWLEYPSTTLGAE